MTMTKKRFRLGAAVATATLSAASVLALASPASAAVNVPTDVTIVASTLSYDNLSVQWKAPVGGDAPTGYKVVFDGPAVAVFPSTIDPDRTEVSVSALPVPATGIYAASLTSASSPAVKANTTYTVSVTTNASGVNSAPVTLVATTLPAPTTVAGPAAAFYPFKSWDALIKQNYKDFLGRSPRLDELVFWRQKLDASPQVPVFATTTNYRLLNPNGTVTSPGLYLTGYRGLDRSYGNYRENDIISNIGNPNNRALSTQPAPLTTSGSGRVYVEQNSATSWTTRYYVSNNVVPGFQFTVVGWSAEVRGEFIAYLYEEARQTYGPTVRLYNAFFPERLGDYGGIEYWRNQLASGKRSLEWIANYFTTSSEFKRTYETLPDGTARPLDDAEFVALVYVNVMKRPADGPGVAFWTRQLSEGKRTRGGVMIGFSESQEYRRFTSHEVQTTVLVNSLGRRAPAELEIVTSKQIAQNGLGNVPTPSRLALLLDAVSFLPVEEPTPTAQYPDPANNESFAFTHQTLITSAAYLARITP